MASIEPRYNRAGQLMHYRLVVSGGLNWEGKQIKRTTTWKPPRPNMSKKQMEREAMAAAFKFEEAIQAGYDIDKVKRFCDYADYVLDLKELHWTLMAKNMGYRESITGMSTGRNTNTTAHRASMSGQTRRISHPTRASTYFIHDD